MNQIINQHNNQVEFNFTTVPNAQNKVQIIHIEKERVVVPIIFIPGVMGSNLKEKTDKLNSRAIWRLDDEASAAGWFLPHYGSAKTRKLELDPEKTEVDDRGRVVDSTANEVSKIEQKCNDKLNALTEDQRQEIIEIYSELKEKLADAISNNHENRLFGTRKERGWGSVGYISYGKFLESFQESLFDQSGNLSSILANLLQNPSFSLDEGSKTKLTVDKDQLKHCQQFYFPVYAMGYNWLKSNADSAEQLKTLVEVTLPKYYKKRDKICDKVILVTHSMGGLVARYYTEALDGAAKVYGVINGVQPATGAVAAYTRMKRGTEVNSTFLGKIKDSIMENVLGKDAAEMTAVCAQSPGPLQLLPTPEYGMRWLRITDPDGNDKFYPKSDPYEEIYLAKKDWWCACEPHLINPLNTMHNQPKMQDDWGGYVEIINTEVKKFNVRIANKYHPNTYVFFGIEEDNQTIKTESLTYQTAHWQGHFVNGYQASIKKPAIDHIGGKNRLDLTELYGIRTITASHNNWLDTEVKTHYGTFATKSGNINETYRLSPADGNGDGTVPKRSGEIDIKHLQARIHLAIDHEGAYKSTISQEFTLRAIINILQQVTFND